MALKTLLNAVTATGVSPAMSTDSNKAAFIQASGITSATVVAQGSIDGSTWSTLGTALTADGLITISEPPPYIRANVTVYLTGTITVKCCT